MLAFSMKDRKERLEELKLLESYLNRAYSIFHVRPESFSKDEALKKVEMLSKEIPSSKFFKEDFEQITQIMNDGCNGKNSCYDTALSIYIAKEEIGVLFKSFTRLSNSNPLACFALSYPPNLPLNN